MATQILTADRLRELLRYEPSSGQFIVVKQRRKHRVGGVAGYVRPDGYIGMMIDRRSYLGHRLAWLYMHGEWPEKLLDHIDGIRANNKWSNLRLATYSLNQQNQKGARGNNKASGLLGVVRQKEIGRWGARICIHGKRTWLGVFPSPTLAQEAYLSAKRNLHPGCTI